MSKTYSIFISHCWDYNDVLINLKNLLNKEDGLVASYEEVTVDAPINSEDEKYIKRVLKARISASDVFIVVAGMYTAHSDWMKWELDKAIEKGVPIIGVIPRGQERISAIVNDRADEIVHWNTESIVSAIRKHAK